ncbi:hypothetical protein QYE76_025098 [Lolium multiflorum]|uniref:DUF6598 domain-containing protein n=1 Tax=Lolium multiflorum TaxID=4521 RepID=A0AAD8VVM9_LOLMU|nr:hypothetical protein QYE76_025098 [Lolium multiflorum]
MDSPDGVMEAVERERSEIRVEERKKSETLVEERKTKKENRYGQIAIESRVTRNLKNPGRLFVIGGTVFGARTATSKHSQLHLQPKREQQQDTTNPPGSRRIRSPSRRASPSRAVVVTSDPSYIKAKLKVKGATESEDKDLSLLATVFRIGFMIRRFTSKLSTLEMNFHEIVRSVEATITIKVIEGS